MTYDLALLGMLILLDELPPEEWGPHLAALGVSQEEAMRGFEQMGDTIRDYQTAIGYLREAAVVSGRVR